jgi:transposase
MPPRTISEDLKARIPILFYEHHLTVKEICSVLGIKKSLVYKSLGYFRAYGIAHNPHSHRPGRHRVLSLGDIKFISALVERQHCIYLDEIQSQLYEHRHCKVSISTIMRTLRRLHLTHKTISAKALERNEIQRSAFMNRIADEVPNPDMLMFVDEAARNRRTSGRSRGWSSRGLRCFQRRFFVRGQRYSILPIITLDGIITHDIIPGSVTSARFIQFLRELVIPLTNPYPGPRSVLILDNCNIHHAEEVRILVEDEALCKLIFLPPYSPDFNPIEPAFFSIKSFLRRNPDNHSLSIMDQACANITTEMAHGFFRASGYIV